MANQQNQTEGMENMGLNSIDIASVSDGYETNQLLSDIRKEESRQLSDQRDQLQYDFDEYILGGTGEALDMDRVETYKNQVEPRRFQESLYKLQESTYAMAPSFGTPVLEKYVGDNPRAYKDFEAHQNREADLYWAGRIQDYHYGIFTYDSRADYPTLDDETYETMGTGGYLSELYNVPIDDVMDNMPTYLGMYADSKKLDEATLNSVFDHIKNDVFEQGESMKRDEQYWVEGLDMALRGDSIEKTLGLREINKDNKRQAQVYRMAADHIYGEYGDNIAKAKDYLLQLGRGDTTAKTLDTLEPQGAEIRKRSEMADRLLEESPENRQQIMGLIFKLAELEGGEVEGAVDRVAKSLGRAFGATVEDIGSGSARFNMGAFIPDFIEPEDDQIEKNRTQRRELMQDLRMARNTYRDITAQGTTEMIAQTTASNIHYMGMFALGPAGVGLMSLDMASKADEQYRMEYPDMDADTRWGLSSAKGIIDAGIEKIKVGALFGGFPSLTKFIGGSGVKRAAGVLGVRVAAAQGVQYVEESAQGMTYPILHKMWVAAGADIPDVDQEVWDRDFWMMEEGDRVPFWDADLFVSMLGLSILTSGGRGVYDKFGGKKVKEMLSDVDKVMMTGYTRKEAEDIVNLNETDTTRAFEQFQDGLADRSKTERKANMDQAKAEGADRRILKTEMDEFKKEIEATGSEEAKRDLRIREVQYDFAMKYDAHLEERDDGKFEMVSPDAEVSPSKVFDTKEEADEAMLQHYQRVDQAFLGSLAEQQERIETLSKNKEAMKLAAKELSTEHSKAGVEADIKLDQDASTLADFAAKGEAEMKTALERVQHELLRKGILRPATVKDFKDWQINAQVQLQKDGRGYVERVSKGGNIADVYEDASEGFLKTMIHKNVVSKDWVKEQIFNYQRDTGDILVDAKSPKDISDLRMTEAFSDLAKANLWNASKDNKTGKLAGLIRALKQYFKSILNAAENLLTLQEEGKIESDFQTLLDQSVGLNMDQQIERQTVEAQQEILDEASMSIMPASDGKPYKDRDGDEAGAPLTETEIQEGIEDESGTLADVDIDTDRLADIGFDSSFSIAKESEWKTLTPEDVRGKKLFAFYADRMRVGTYTGLNPKSGISIAMQGGIDYPQAHKGAAWAVSSDPMHTSIANAADAKDGIALVLAYQTGNVTGNETFADAYIEELKWSIKSGDITEADALAILNKVRAESVKLYQTKQKRDQRIEDANAAEKGRAPLTKAVAPWVVNNASDWKSVDEFFDSLTNEGATFDSRGQKMFKTGFDANGVVTAQKLGSQANVKQGMPDVAEMVKLMEVEGSSDINYGDVMGLVQIDKGQAGNPVDAETLGVDPHRSYPKILTGKPYGKLPKRTNILDIFDPRKGVVPMAGEVLKFKDEGVVATLEETSFSITPAQDATYMDAVESGDVETQQRMVDEAAKRAGYDSPKVYHGTPKAGGFTQFDPKKQGQHRKDGIDKGYFFTSKRELAKKYTSFDGSIITAHLKIENPYTIAVPKHYSYLRNKTTQQSQLFYDGNHVEIQNAARNGGHDGIIVEGSDKLYIAFNANQIKSADPVTKDADGNVIPLSQRFDASRDEVSFSIGRSEITPTADTKVVEGSNATVVGEASFSIGAWHGTPHKVDKFRTDQIGTGEGAQAYGYGLYFAEDKDVSVGYRARLSQDSGAGKGELTALAQHAMRGKTTSQALAELQESVDRLSKAGGKKEFLQKYIDAIESIEVAAGIKKLGNLYQVELNVEQEQLLDWDKPLSEQVHRKLEEMLGELRWDYNAAESLESKYQQQWGKISGRDIYEDLVAMFGYTGGRVQISNRALVGAKQASEALLAAGIKGIKYLDGTSRGAGEGTYNYVMFDDADIKITEENGKAVSMDEVESVSMSIGSAQDAAYMDAVESGDVETQQRMVDEAAKRAGYDQKGLHSTWIGSNEKPFDVFNFKKKPSLKTAVSDWGVFFTPNHDVTPTQDMYAFMAGQNKVGGKARHIKAWLQMSNPKEVAREDFYRFMDWGSLDTQEYKSLAQAKKAATAYKNEAIEQGYDGFIIGGSEVVVFSPNQIKSADPVTKDADGNVIPLSQRFDAGRDEISMSLAQAEDPVMSKIRSLMRDPEMREEVYRSMSERLQMVRDRVYAKHIAFGETTAESMKDAERQMSDREFITSSVAQVQAIVNVLPMEVRGKAGSILEIVKRSSSRGVTNELMKKIDKIDSILDKYMSDGYLDKLNKSRKQGKLKKGKQEKIARGTITPIKHNELDLIEDVLALSDEKVDAEIAKNEATLTNPATKEDEATDAVVNIIRLQTYGKLVKEGKRPQANAMVMKEASDQLAKLIQDGKAAYAVLQEEKKARRSKMKDEMVDVVSGGKGIPDDNLKSKSRRERKGQKLKNFILEGKAKMNSWEHLVEHLSRLDPSPSMESRLRVWTEKVHQATYAEERAVAEKQVAFERAVGEIYGVDTSKKTWHSKTLPYFERMSEQVERNIGVAFSNSKQTVSVKAEHAAELVTGLHTKILVNEGLVTATNADIKALEEQMKRHPNAKTYKFERQEHKNIQNIHLSVDEILNLTMLYGQEGYKELMHFHGYSAEVMETLEGELSEQDRQVRSYMLDYNDKNYDHFNKVYAKIFGVNMRKVRGYSKASFEHQGMQPVELMDADGATAMSVTPAAGMARIQHLAKPKQDAGAVGLFLQGMSETEHFVAWGELVGDMRSSFLNKDVQDTIEVYHGNQIKHQINESINEFTQGGVAISVNNRYKLLDKLRSDFTVMSLAYKWSIAVKQMTSLPAYASHIPIADYIKYQAEFFTSFDNFKKIASLPYTKHRFNHGHDRDVMIILNHSGKKSKLEKAADFGMKGVSVGDITPVIIGGYAAYRHGYERAKKANPKAGEAHFEARGILAFEMLTDNAQQAGNIKDMSGFAKGGSLARVMTMYTTSLIQYTNNETTAIMDALAKRVDSKKKLAKILAINHLILPSFFYWVSWATANAFKSDDDDETAKEAMAGWIAAMVLGPFSGLPVIGKALGSLASGYSYEMPVFSSIKAGARGFKKMREMMMEVDDITPDDVLEAADHIADAISYSRGKGLGKAYEISKNFSKSIGFDRYDARRLAMNEVDGAVHDLAELHKAIYAEPMPDKEDKAAYRQAERERWISLADEYSFVKGETEDSWEKIAEKLKKKNLLPQKVEKLMK